MLRVLGRPSRLCDGSTRREVLRAGALSAFGVLGLPLFPTSSHAASSHAASSHAGASREASAKSVILINLLGGPSHIDMFDMKPGAPAEIRGEFSPIDTSLSGLQICELLPRTARTMHLSSLIRTHTHLYNTHSPYNLLSGYSGPVIVDNVAKPTDHPSVGAVMQHAGLRSPGVPPYVWMPSHPGHSQGKHRAGPYAGFLGRQYDPLFTRYEPHFEPDDIQRAARVNPPTPLADPVLDSVDRLPEITLRRLKGRRSLLEQIDRQRAELNASPRGDVLNRFQHKALEMLTSSKTRDAFDLARESTKTRERYGRSLFGSCLLTARKLVQAGVKFVGVTTESQYNGGIGAGQWDTHGDNFKLLKNFNLPVLDTIYSALIEDLETRGMLDSTLVVLMGEMGRTPKVNRRAGRDHWTQCGFILLTGGGVKRGEVYGRSDKQAAWPVENPVSSADHIATLYQLLGVDPHMTLLNRGQRVPLSHDGEPVWGVIA